MLELLIHSRSLAGLDWLNDFGSENIKDRGLFFGKFYHDDLINQLDPANFTWNIMPGNHVLHLHISIHPAPVDKHKSLDPYFFIQEINLN